MNLLYLSGKNAVIKLFSIINEYVILFQDIFTKNLFQNGKHTLSIQLGDKKFMLACPDSTPEEPRLPPEVVGSDPDLPSEAAEHSPESLKHFVWSPPFYLAPPLYPHPTYKHSHPDSHDPSTSSPPTPAPIFDSQSVPPVGSLSDYQDYFLYPDSLNEHVKHDSWSSAGDTGSSGQFSGVQQAPLSGVFEQRRVTPAPSTRLQTQVGSPSLAPPIRTLNRYQHPNIALPAPQYAASAPVAESPLLASVLHHPGAAGQFNMDLFFPSRPAHTTPARATAPNARYPAQPHSDHQWHHFQHDGPKLPPFNPELLVARHASSHQSSRSALDNNPYWTYGPLSKDSESCLLNAGEVSPPEQTSFPADIPSPPFYHHPQHHNRIYYGPERSPSGLVQMPSNNNPLLRTFRPMSPSPLSEPGYDHHTPHYHRPETSVGDGDVPHEGNINPKSDPRLPSDSDRDFTVWLDQLSEAENPSMLQSNPSNIYLYNTDEVYPGVEEPDELLDNQIEGKC